MNFEEFKQATQRFNVLKRSDVAGSYHFGTATVSFESLERSDVDAIIQQREILAGGERLSGPQYEAMAKVMPLAAHEYTHFVDSTSTVWGMKLLSCMNSAYSCSDAFQQDEAQFWNAKRFYDLLRSIALPDYYTVKRGAENTRPWRATVTAGQVFDKDGRVTGRPILFQRFSNAADEEMVRSPMSTVSILESSAMAQETAFRMGLVSALVEDYGIVERREISRRLMDYLYNPDITEYSVCVHLAANVLGTPDVGSAFAVCAVLTRVCLNLTDEAFDELAADEELMRRVRLPSDHAFSRRMRDGLRSRDLGTAFHLMTRCLPHKPGLTLDEAEAVARQAIEALGIDLPSVHARAITFGERVEQELKGSQIEPIRWLAEAGLDNLRRINPLARRLDFAQLHLPQALLGDSTEFFGLGNPHSPLAARKVDSVFEPLLSGELWVERFAEGCL
ncbi:hypothetical protein [Roseateles flavus]|uniref:FRG domain-containing protein n=1 Tax=Roseateles flavus TaxID=3149041 RepID=A0ABV0G8V7_9BURK